MLVTQKMVQLGDYYRHYRYDSPKLVKSLPKKVRTKLVSSSYEVNRLFYSDIAKRNLRDIVLSNLNYGNPRFITLTYATPEFSNSKAKLDFKKFIMRLRYHLEELGYNRNFRYIAVPEQHDSEDTSSTRRFSYHFHIILFDLPYISTTFYSKNWTHGFIKINLIKGSPFSTAYYLTKYLSKQTTHKRCERRFLVSRNIQRPKQIHFHNIPTLMYKKGVNYNTSTGSKIRIDYYENYSPFLTIKKNNTLTITYRNK